MGGGGGGEGRGGTEEIGRFQVSRFLNPRRPDYLEAWNWIYYVMTTSQATIKGDWYSRMKRSVEKLRRRSLLGSLHTIRIFFFFAVLAFCPHVTGVFGHQKCRFSRMVPGVEFFENAGL